MRRLEEELFHQAALPSFGLLRPFLGEQPASQRTTSNRASRLWPRCDPPWQSKEMPRGPTWHLRTLFGGMACLGGTSKSPDSSHAEPELIPMTMAAPGRRETGPGRRETGPCREMGDGRWAGMTRFFCESPPGIPLTALPVSLCSPTPLPRLCSLRPLQLRPPTGARTGGEGALAHGQQQLPQSPTPPRAQHRAMSILGLPAHLFPQRRPDHHPHRGGGETKAQGVPDP